MAADEKHSLIKGHGKWKQCVDCGATYYSGQWWLGGFKSKTPPTCGNMTVNSEWTKTADKIVDFDNPSSEG